MSATYQTELRTRQRSEQTSARSLLAFLFAATLGCAAVSGVLFVATLQERWALLALGILCIPVLMWHHWFRKPDLFEPINFIGLSVFLGVVTTIVYIVFVVDEFAHDNLLMGQPESILVWTLIIILVGLIALSLGYSIKPHAHFVPLPSLVKNAEWSTKKLIIVMVLLVGISLYCMVAFIGAMGIELSGATSLGAISQKRRFVISDATYQYASLGYLRWGASLLNYVFLFLFTVYAVSKKSLFSLLGAFTVVAAVLCIPFPVLTSARSELVITFVQAVVIWHYVRKPISLKVLGILVVIGFAVIVLMGALRAIPAGKSHVSVGEVISEQTLGQIVQPRNWLDVSKTAHIINAIPELLEYQYGKTMLTWIVAPIPRSVWKSKPEIRPGPYLGETVFEWRRNIAGVPPGIVAELYWNFGLFGVPLGMALLGMILRLISVNFLAEIRNVNVALLYSALVIPLTIGISGGDVSGAIIDCLMSIITISLIILFIRRKQAKPYIQRRPVRQMTVSND